jgi:hypothetical protein
VSRTEKQMSIGLNGPRSLELGHPGCGDADNNRLIHDAYKVGKEDSTPLASEGTGSM